ncbi:hypothetical protein AVEN_241890-1 [Araneus ventricosus]|uniref:Secreted protein n=1 Tax=Araneus ventricosus TaxID=182803 RepID=A0A4Y2WS52_ARAVE|nr:hypothetical protein AVEN_241890-1 [Araneus ventricosus]
MAHLLPLVGLVLCVKNGALGRFALAENVATRCTLRAGPAELQTTPWTGLVSYLKRNNGDAILSSAVMYRRRRHTARVLADFANNRRVLSILSMPSPIPLVCRLSRAAARITGCIGIFTTYATLWQRWPLHIQ